MLIKKSSIVRLLLSWMIKLCHMFTYCQSEAHTHTYYDENTFRHLIVGSFISWKKSLSIKSQSRHVIILGFLLFPCQSVNNNESVGPWLGKCVCAPVRRMSYGLRFHFTRFKCRLSGKKGAMCTWFQLMHQSPCTRSPRIVFLHNYVSLFFARHAMPKLPWIYSLIQTCKKSHSQMFAVSRERRKKLWFTAAIYIHLIKS